MKLRNIEITIAAILLLLAVYSLFASVSGYIAGRFSDAAYGREMFTAKGLHFNFWINYFLPVLLKYFTCYIAFIWTACSLPNKFIAQHKWGKATLSVTAGIIVVWLLFVLSDCIKMPFDDYILSEALFREFGVAAALTGIILLYEILKLLAIALLKRDAVKNSWENNTLRTDMIWFLVIWGMLLFACLFLQPYWGFGLFWALIIPSAFACYLACFYWIIPRYYHHVEKRGSGNRYFQ